jgi:Icc protein
MLTPTYTLIQLSDTHIVPEGQLLHGSVDSLANVAAALAAVEESGVCPAALIFSGDLADTGDPQAYQRLRAAVEPVAARLGAPVLWAMGNHDTRTAFRAGLLGAESTGEAFDYVHWSGDLRVIVLDSTEPGHHHGELSDDQLVFLEGELRTPAPAGTVLVLHHPPVPSPLPFINTLLLRQPERLGAVLAGSDVSMVLCGHSHHASAGALAGVPVWVAGASAYSADTLAPTGRFRGQVGGSYTRVDVFDGVTVATAIPIGRGETVYELTVDDLLRHAHAA